MIETAIIARHLNMNIEATLYGGVFLRRTLVGIVIEL